MPAPSTHRVHTFLSAVVLATAYYVGVRVGFLFTVEPNATSMLWPPNAIVLAVLLLNPPRSWPWLLLAVVPPHFYAELSGGVPISMASCWYVSNVLEALLGAALVRTFLGRAPRFSVLRDASVFLACAVFAAPIVSSFVDAAFVAWIDWRFDGDYWRVWRMRLFSNALATLVLVPLVVSIGTARLPVLRASLAAKGLEAAAILVLLVTASWIVFHRHYPIGESATFVYLPLPFLFWAAIRLGAGGVALCAGVLALSSMAGELRGLGPFIRAGEAGVWSLQIFLIITTTSLMLLAASLAELRHARVTAQRRKQRLDLALAAARMGVWEWDLRTNQIKWRMSPGRFNVAPAGALLQRVHPDEREAVTAAMRAARDGDSAAELECRFVDDGVERWITTRGRVVRSRRGTPKRVTGVYIDTTKAKRQEDRERSQREQLAHLSRVSMLGELSGAVTHELGQPIAAILLNAETGLRELEKKSPDLVELTAIMQDIIADDTRAGEVIRRLRALFIRGSVQKEPVDLGECINAVINLEHSDLIARGIVTKIDIAEGLPTVAADPVQIQQVLLNLVMNAGEAMAAVAPDQRELSISVRPGEESTLYVRVQDSGPGIERPDDIFEPFVSSKTQNIGIGLAISRSIIGAHGGQLWATNNPDRGATFHVRLPIGAS